MSLSTDDKKYIDSKLEAQKDEILTQVDSKLEAQKDEILEEMNKFRSDFFDKVDPILNEVLTAREDRTLIENRIEELENIHQTPPHSLSA